MALLGEAQLVGMQAKFLEESLVGAFRTIKMNCMGLERYEKVLRIEGGGRLSSQGSKVKRKLLVGSAEDVRRQQVALPLLVV